MTRPLNLGKAILPSGDALIWYLFRNQNHIRILLNLKWRCSEALTDKVAEEVGFSASYLDCGVYSMEYGD